MNKYTEPKLVKGPEPKPPYPKDSTKEKEWAKNTWYVNYSFNSKQYRIKNNINRITDAKEKSKQANLLLKAIKQALENGYNPADPEAYEAKFKATNISLAAAVEEYLADKRTYIKGKSVDDYESKLHFLVKAFPTQRLKDIQTEHIENYIYDKIHKGEQAVMNLEGRVIQTSKITKWTPGTVAAARTYFTSFFNWCMAKARKYIDENPMHGINEMKINSNNEAPERHMPFSTEQLRAVLQYLDENDKYMALFCRSIFYTCVRPKELRGLRVADINLNNGTMKVRMDVMKTSQKPKPDIVHLDRNFIPHLEQLNLHTFPPHYRLFSGNFEKVVGEKSVGVNTPLNRLKTALQKLGLNGKGHGVYSFKHTSNIQRLNAGWELAQIMKANRHSSITETEKYLKGLLALTDISKLEVPAF